MTAAIVHIILGVPLTDEVGEKISHPDYDEKWFEDDDGECGFTTLYSGHAMHPIGYCGVELYRLWEGQVLENLPPKLAYSADQAEEARSKVDALDPDLSRLCPPFGVHLIWSTS